MHKYTPIHPSIHPASQPPTGIHTSNVCMQTNANTGIFPSDPLVLQFPRLQQSGCNRVIDRSQPHNTCVYITQPKRMHLPCSAWSACSPMSAPTESSGKDSALTRSLSASTNCLAFKCSTNLDLSTAASCIRVFAHRYVYKNKYAYFQGSRLCSHAHLCSESRCAMSESPATLSYRVIKNSFRNMNTQKHINAYVTGA